MLICVSTSRKNKIMPMYTLYFKVTPFQDMASKSLLSEFIIDSLIGWKNCKFTCKNRHFHRLFVQKAFNRWECLSIANEITDVVKVLLMEMLFCYTEDTCSTGSCILQSNINSQNRLKKRVIYCYYKYCRYWHFYSMWLQGDRWLKPCQQ